MAVGAFGIVSRLSSWHARQCFAFKLYKKNVPIHTFNPIMPKPRFGEPGSVCSPCPPKLGIYPLGTLLWGWGGCWYPGKTEHQSHLHQPILLPQVPQLPVLPAFLSRRLCCPLWLVYSAGHSRNLGRQNEQEQVSWLQLRRGQGASSSALALEAACWTVGQTLRLLRPGGQLILSQGEHNFQAPWLMAANPSWRFPGQPLHELFKDHLCQQAGLILRSHGPGSSRIQLQGGCSPGHRLVLPLSSYWPWTAGDDFPGRAFSIACETSPTTPRKASGSLRATVWAYHNSRDSSSAHSATRAAPAPAPAAPPGPTACPADRSGLPPSLPAAELAVQVVCA